MLQHWLAATVEPCSIVALIRMVAALHPAGTVETFDSGSELLQPMHGS